MAVWCFYYRREDGTEYLSNIYSNAELAMHLHPGKWFEHSAAESPRTYTRFIDGVECGRLHLELVDNETYENATIYGVLEIKKQALFPTMIGYLAAFTTGLLCCLLLP